MSQRPLLLVLLAGLAVGGGRGAPAAQDPAPAERVWTLVRELRRDGAGASGYWRWQWKVTVVYMERYTQRFPGHYEWIAGPRRVEWSGSGEAASFDNVHHVTAATAAESPTRTRADEKVTCSGGASFETGPPSEWLSPEQTAQMRFSCTSAVRIRPGHPLGGRTSSGPAETPMRPVLPDGVSESDLTECRYRSSRTWRRGGDFEVETQTASLTPPFSATLDYASAEDRRFVPVPGRTIRVSARSSSPMLWAFDINPVSKLRGYATNADIDSAFFESFKLPYLANQYDTRDADLIFDPVTYHGYGDGVPNWKAPSSGPSSNKWGRLESNERLSGAQVDITAMDFGAHGSIRAYVKPPCGDWVQVGKTLRLPLDDNDNAIADALPEYNALPATADEDALPKGDGVNGDGLTAFEEYRGFVTSTALPCSPADIQHDRTSPAKKDLFVSVTDPLLRAAAGLFPTLFVPPDGHEPELAVHLICPEQYLSDSVKIVNFTMHVDPGSAAGGRLLTQAWPQHGVRLVNAPLSGRLATASNVGPPGEIDKVTVDVARLLDFYRNERPKRMLMGITWHELAHAASITHHGTGNVPGPFVILQPVTCPARTTEGTVNGNPACLGTRLAMRHGQNSGQDTCPMKYSDWNWYVPEGSMLTKPHGVVTFKPLQEWPWMRVRHLPAYIGPIASYRKDKDDMGLAGLCTTTAGSGVNAPGHENHAGDAAWGACARQLHVSDVR